jgi:NAD(P)-dependent dehydrogenase (short-subunit alcohol dehydrogenase family)
LRAISPGTTVLPVKADISSVEEVDNLYKKIQQTFGRPADVLLNNAGYLRDDEFIGETPVEEWWKGIVSPHFLFAHRNLLIMKCRKLTSKAATL